MMVWQAIEQQKQLLSYMSYFLQTWIETFKKNKRALYGNLGAHHDWYDMNVNSCSDWVELISHNDIKGSMEVPLTAVEYRYQNSKQYRDFIPLKRQECWIR